MAVSWLASDWMKPAMDLPEIQHIVDTLTATVTTIRRVTFAGAGHMVNLEQSDRFTQVVLDFLRPDT